MCEFLKDYHLYDDLVRLNNKQYFHREFQVNDTLEFFGGLASMEDVKRQKKTIRMFLVNLKHCETKCIFLVMKWLIVTHQIINVTKLQVVLERIVCALQEIGQPKIQNKYEEYCYKQLIKPYTKYLIKLGLSLTLKRQTDNLHSPQREITKQLWYIEYNLLSYAANEFLIPIREFSGFFNEYYPFLNRFQQLLKKDLKGLFKQIKQCSEIRLSSQITHLQLSVISTQLQAMDELKKENFMTQREDTFEDLQQSQIIDFFKSAQKQIFSIKTTSNSITSQ